MVRIAPVRLMLNPKTLWFDARDLSLSQGEDVVVLTSRGLEFATMVQSVFEMDEEETKKLPTPLKPVKRKATDEDRAKAEELVEKSQEALPVFKRLAAEVVPDMNPVAVEYLFDGDKAVFYFESEERLDFRDLVRKLAGEFHVRVDMKQIGVRDEARMIGGIGHCGQELCCRRLGGEFSPVSIRMAKEQDLSLNPQKISGVCGRLMCCLRYEYDAYKDFHTRAPKKNAKIATPEGEGKVVDLDAVREVVSIKVGDEKPVKIPLADMDAPEEGARPSSVGEESWARAKEPAAFAGIEALSLFGSTSNLTGADKLADPSHVRHVHEDDEQQPKRKRRVRSSSKQGQEVSASAPATQPHQTRRRRSTTVSVDGTSTVEKAAAPKPMAKATAGQADQKAEKKAPARRRRRSGKKADGAQAQAAVSQAKQPGKAGHASPEKQNAASQVGRKSSALRARREQEGPASGQETPSSETAAAHRRPRRRRRKTDTGTVQDGSQA